MPSVCNRWRDISPAVAAEVDVRQSGPTPGKLAPAPSKGLGCRRQGASRVLAEPGVEGPRAGEEPPAAAARAIALSLSICTSWRSSAEEESPRACSSAAWAPMSLSTASMEGDGLS